MFAFGVMGALDPIVSMASIYLVILFILIFEFVTGLLEYCIKESPLYNKMVQHIYKELMQMGIVSFLVVLYESVTLTADVKWIEAIDFAHILLFFFCIFFVIHAFVLMGTSVIQSHAYLKMDRQSYFACLESLSTRSVWSYVTYYFPLVNISGTRRVIEYKIISTIFQDTYCRIPSNFYFPLYLAKCFDRYSLKVIEVSPLSWFVLIILVLINFLRVKYEGWNACTSEYSVAHEEERRYLISTFIQTHFGSRKSASDVHLESTNFDDDHSREHNQHCYEMYLEVFFILALGLCGYLLILLVVARYYEQK
jgi:hypothetical protein